MIRAYYFVRVLDNALTDDFLGEVAHLWDERVVVNWTTVVYKDVPSHFDTKDALLERGAQTSPGERFTRIPAGRFWDRKQALIKARRERSLPSRYTVSGSVPASAGPRGMELFAWGALF